MLNHIMKKQGNVDNTLSGRFFSILNVTALLVFAVLALYPFLHIYIYVFNDGLDSLKAPLYLWPRKLSFDNILIAFMQQGIVNAFYISILRTVIGTVLAVIATSSLAYVLSKRYLPGYRFFSYFFFITFMFSGGFIPLFLTLKELKVYDSFLVFLLLPGVGIYSYLYMIIFRSFFDSLPASLEESAEIDGASYSDILIRLIVPISKPVYAAIALFFAINHWNDWFSGIFYIRKETLMPLQSLLQRMITEADQLSRAYKFGGGMNAGIWSKVTPYSIRLAVVVISITPIMLVYPFMQKHFVKGIMIGAVKG